MKISATIPLVTMLVSLAHSKVTPVRVDDSSASLPKNTTVHFFVLMVPDSAVQELKRARQDEEGIAGGVTETGVYVGQIISGVLGGDVRPIFAGSASFIDEPDVQMGVSTILANVAPSLNNILKSWVTRAQTFLGIATTPRPGSVVLNQTNSANSLGGASGASGIRQRPSYGTIAGQSPIALNEANRLQTIQLQQQLAQLQLQQQNLVQSQSPQRPQTIAGSNVISGYDLFDMMTTPPPLPIIKLKPDEDDEEGDLFKKVVKL